MTYIEPLPLSEIKHMKALFKHEDKMSASPYKIGQYYWILTPNIFFIGKIKRVTPKEIVLEDAGIMTSNDNMKWGPDIKELIIERSSIVAYAKRKLRTK